MREAGQLATLVRRHRVAAGLSQEVLAERAGISVRGLSDLERGLSRTARLHTLARLADALGLSGEARTELLTAGHQPRRPSRSPRRHHRRGRSAACPACRSD
jgi:transcriptional regulator with XRE-family HTH domain